ncbi:unnamed protein product [marine sediment metagenome]|uniref:Uncharacterized protein n=1 Tax=marine sediment metagenome TaxID=412755 RepID=X1Q173_9ZZZZ
MPQKFLYPITFLPCEDLTQIRSFYEGILQLPVVLEQKKCLIIQIGNESNFAYWGFCSHYDRLLNPPEKVCLTLVVSTRDEVDKWHQYLMDYHVVCNKEPKYNPEFRIYNAFYRDPMDYTIEIQSFDRDARPEGTP